MVSKAGFGCQIFADKRYIVHTGQRRGYHGEYINGQTGYFDTEEQAKERPEAAGREVVTSEELVKRKKELVDLFPREH